MLHSWRKYRILTISIIIIMLLAGLGEVRLLPEPASPRALKPAEIEQFRQLIRQYHEVRTHAVLTGDVTEYPDIFYNDPAFDLRQYTPGCFPLIYVERSETNAILKQMDNRPVGSKNGLLSCMIAEMIDYHRNANAWEIEVKQAEAEGRNPSIANLENGLVPINRARKATDWSGPKYAIEAIYLDDTHVRFTYAAAPIEELPDVVYHLIFTNVRGRWLLSAEWTSFPRVAT